MQNYLVRDPELYQKSGDREQPVFTMYYHSIRYKSDVFAVRCSALLLQILRYAQKDIPCHHRRSRCVVILNEAQAK